MRPRRSSASRRRCTSSTQKFWGRRSTGGGFTAGNKNNLAARLQALPTTNAAARQFGRFMSSGAVEIELDRQGRILVPGYLREYAALDIGEGGVVGALNRLEIWAPSRWQPYRSQIEDEPEALAEHLADLGI